MRLINADALIDMLKKLCDANCPYTKKQRDVMCRACTLGDAFSAVDDAPTIHPEPCSVCKWKDEYPWDHCEGCKAEGVSE